MKKLFVIVLLYSPFYLSAQKLVATIPISGSGTVYVKDVRAFAIGDSIYLSYQLSSGMSSTKTMLITPNGSVKEFVMPELYRKTILGLNDDKDSVYFNYFEKEKKEIHLKAVAISKESGEMAFVKKSFIVTEGTVGSFYEGGFNLVTINEQDSTLNFSRMIKSSLSKTASYRLPPTVFKRGSGNRSFAFIYEGDRILAPAALAGIKIYCNSNEIIVMEKVPTVKPDEKGTIVTRINRSTGKSESKYFKVPEVGFSSSFFIGEDLFWIHQKKGLQIIASNWSQNLNTEYQIDKHVPYINEMSAAGVPVDEAIKFGPDEFIAGYPASDGSVYLKVGTRKLLKTGLIIPNFGSVAMALVQLTTLVTTTALDEGISIDNFFYLRKDSNDFTFTEPTEVIEQKILSYEKALVKRVPNKYKWDFRDYIKSPTGTIALYVLNIKPKQIEVVKFDK